MLNITGVLFKPVLNVTILEPIADPVQNITRGVLYNFSAFVNNTGFANATYACLTWDLPYGWEIVSGNKTNCFSTLGIGEIGWNNITVKANGSTAVGSHNIGANADCLQRIYGSASVSVNVVP